MSFLNNLRQKWGTRSNGGESLINILKLMEVYCFIEKVMPVSKWFGVILKFWDRCHFILGTIINTYMYTVVWDTLPREAIKMLYIEYEHIEIHKTQYNKISGKGSGPCFLSWSNLTLLSSWLFILKVPMDTYQKKVRRVKFSNRYIISWEKRCSFLI